MEGRKFYLVGKKLKEKKLFKKRLFEKIFVIVIVDIIINLNLHAKSEVSSSKNGRVMAVGTKEDTLLIVYIS